jgi:tetratricopeptide (TPR) repeat protein
MSRETCLDCVRKHLAQASVLMDEAALGYPHHRWYAYGHLAEAESESRREYPEFSKEVRECRVQIMHNDFQGAVEDCSKMIQLNPRDTSAYELRGIAFCKLLDYGPALKDFNRAIELHPESARPYLCKGLMYAEMSLLGEAIAELTKAIEINPRDENALFERASVYKEMDKYNEAILDLGNLILIKPKKPRYYFERANAYSLNRNPRKALPDINRAVRLQEKSKKTDQTSLAHSYAMRSKIHFDLKNYGESLSDYEKSQGIVPEKPSRELKNFLTILKRKLDKLKSYQ